MAILGRLLLWLLRLIRTRLCTRQVARCRQRAPCIANVLRAALENRHRKPPPATRPPCRQHLVPAGRGAYDRLCAAACTRRPASGASGLAGRGKATTAGRPGVQELPGGTASVGRG